MSQAVERLLLESDSLLNVHLTDISKTDDGDSPSYTLEDATLQIREWAMYNFYHPKRYERMTYKEMAKELRLCGYALPPEAKEWTPELVSYIIQKKGRL